MATPPISIPLARATVGDSVEIDILQDDQFEVIAGQPFRVAFAYEITETSGHEDLWRFKLRVNVVDEDEQINEIRIRDRRILRDDIWSHIAQDHVVPEAGEYTVEVELEAELLRRPWNDPLPKRQVAHKNATMTLKLVALQGEEKMVTAGGKTA